MNIGILGAGTWGIALARMLELNGHDVTVWSVLPREIEQLEATRSHPNLPEIVLPAEIGYTTSMAEACRHKDIILFAVPSVFVLLSPSLSELFRCSAAAVKPPIASGIAPQ